MTPKWWVALAAAVLAAGLPFLPEIVATEFATHDWRFQHQERLTSSQRVFVVAIDDEAAKKWMEPRAFWAGRVADLIGALNRTGASTIGVDMSFSQSADGYLDSIDPDGKLSRPNAKLMQAIFQSKAKVWLATKTRGEDWAKEDFAGVKQHWASSRTPYANLTIVRRMDSVDQGFPTLAFACAGAPTRISKPYWINYRLPEVTVIPALDLLSGKFDSASLMDAIVLVGETDDASGDLQITPYPPNSQTDSSNRSGVQVQAEAIRTLLSGSELKVPSRFVVVVSASLIALACGLLAMTWSWTRYTGLAFVAGLAYTGTSLAALQSLHLMLPLAAPLITMLFVVPMIAYPVREVQRRFDLQLSEAERARIRSKWGQMIDDRLVRFIEQKQSAGLGPLGTFDAAFLYLDVANFAGKSNALSPEAMLDNVNRMFEAFVPIIQDHKGIVITFTGDGLTSGFETLEGEVDQRERALESALKILAELDRLNAKDSFEGGAWSIRIGLGSGPVTLALVGSEQRQTMAYYGEAVNLASRLEQAGKELKVSLTMSEPYVEVAARMGIALEERSLQLKGWQSAMRVWVLSNEP